MARRSLESWGRLHQQEYEAVDIPGRSSSLNFPETETALPFGNGRSYGDSCLNPGGTAIHTKYLDHFISFDSRTGVLICEAGLQMTDIIPVILPRGWFFPVTPGTRHVTIGGAIANDVHGKNHHITGTFGCHVRRFELLRSDGQRLICAPNENAGWYAATIGGLGLTGLIIWAEIQLQPVAGPWMNTETTQFASLDEFTALSDRANRDREYTVAWLDCSKNVAGQGRGLFISGDHTAAPEKPPSTRQITLPPLPVSLINSLSVRVFNFLYAQKNTGKKIQHLEPFFYPLDGVGSWNRVYGPKGFYQYQCVIPRAQGITPVKALLKETEKSGMYSFLSVLKAFGPKTSPGMLSFPCEGLTLTIDFANQDEDTLHFFTRLDAIVQESGGRLYPAKDARMPGALFRAGYPQWEKFSKFIDPRFSSGFWRRVMEGT